jgi:hypothetical protein
MRNIDLLINPNESVESIIENTISNQFREKRRFWAGTPFNHFIVISPAKIIGIFGEHLIDRIYSNMDKIIQPGKGGYDIRANDMQIEVKTSFMSQDGRYRICQIRPNADYDKMIFVFISPDGIQFFQTKKKHIHNAIKKGILKSSHNDYTNKNTKLYLISDTLDNIVEGLNLRNITNLMSRWYTEADVSEVVRELLSNRMELRRHMIGSKMEDISMAPSMTISKFGKTITKNVLSNCAIDWEQAKQSENDKPKYIVRTSCITSDGEFSLCQIRPNEPFDYMVFIAVEPDDIHLYYCTKDDVVSATKLISKQHNNGKRKPSLYNVLAPKENIISTFNMREL